MRFRLLNKIYAFIHGYFWLPCPICGQHFGGHEWETSKPNSSVMLADDSGGYGICPECTKRDVADKYVADENENIFLRKSN